MVDVDKIIRYENGEMEDEEVIEMFQELVDSGDAWTLQGHYGRTAQSLIEEGLVRMPMTYAVFVRRYGWEGNTDSQFSRWHENREQVEIMGENVHRKVSGMDTDIGSVVVLDRDGGQVWEMEV